MNDIILANLGYGSLTQARLRNIPSVGYDCLRWKKPGYVFTGRQGCGSGSAFIFPTGSESAFNIRIRIQEGNFLKIIVI